jgi:NADH dehydrogenase
MTGAMVEEAGAGAVTIRVDGVAEQIPAATVVWAAGTKGSQLGRALVDAAGAEVDRGGRIIVGPDLHPPGLPDVFVIGDLAHVEQDGAALPGVAPVAIQQGQYVAGAIVARLEGRDAGAFRYASKGNMATIGRSAAVADLGKVRLTGLIGWLAWLFIHLVSLERFENRFLVFTQWAWNYVTRGRSAKLITGREFERPHSV